MVFDQEEYDRVKKETEVLEQEIEDGKTALIENDMYSTIDDVEISSMTCCQKISLYQTSEVEGREEKIIEATIDLGECIMNLEKMHLSSERSNNLKFVRYIDGCLDRIMDAKSKHKIDS
jgi:hypothetical protein